MRSPWDHIGPRGRRIGVLLGLVGCALLAWSLAPGGMEAPTAAVVSEGAAPGPRPLDPAQPVAVVPPHPAITVRVVIDGAPAADATVSITDGSRPVLASARSDRDGGVAFPALPPGAYELW
ncbi:MAG: carboxypeptidase regulatory-like domain-containing protein, partial [Deltaproteobacteria bacterium]|nr:carboxypeptidase regulatory-like domain-containing protein [Deltaproteobacteria bacterium]